MRKVLAAPCRCHAADSHAPRGVWDLFTGFKGFQGLGAVKGLVLRGVGFRLSIMSGIKKFPISF